MIRVKLNNDKTYEVTPCGWNTDHNRFYAKIGNKSLVITDSGCEGWIDADSRYMTLYNENVLYDGIGFNITNGLAISNGIIETKRIVSNSPYKDVKDDSFINDVVKAEFPTIEEIFNDAETLIASLYYYEELCEEGLESLFENGGEVALTWLFEGFFFGDDRFITYSVKRGTQPFKISQKRTK